MDRDRGQALKAMREAAGLLQRQVGAEFDIDKAAVSSWESGRSRPDVKKLRRLDEMYGQPGAVLALFDLSPHGDDEQRQAERRLLLVMGQAIVTLLDAAEVDGQEDLDELRAELQSAMRAVQ